MGKKVKPENIVYMLQHNAKWQISGNKMRINIEYMGLNWFDELRECVKMLGEKVDKAKIEGNNGVVAEDVESVDVNMLKT